MYFAPTNELTITTQTKRVVSHIISIQQLNAYYIFESILIDSFKYFKFK